MSDPLAQAMVGVNPNPPTLTVGVDNAYATPEEIALQRQRAKAILAQGADMSPVKGGWVEGLARIGQGALGGLEQRRAAEMQQRNQKIDNDTLAAAMAGGTVDYQKLLASPAYRNVALQGMAQEAQTRRQEARDDKRYGAQEAAQLRQQEFQERQAEMQRQHQAQLRADQIAAQRANLEESRAARQTAEPEKIKLLRLAGVDPQSPEGRQIIRDSLLKSGVTVNTGGVQGPPEDVAAFRKKLGEKGAEFYKGVADSADTAGEVMRNVGAARKALDAGLRTGAGAETVAGVARAAQAFGVDPKGILGVNPADVDAFNSAANSLVLGLAEKMKGALSEKDLAFLQQSGPQLLKTPEGNRRVLDLMEQGAQNAMRRQSMLDDWISRYGTPMGRNPDGLSFSQAWQREIAVPVAPPAAAEKPAGGAKPDYKSKYGLE